MNVVFDIGNVLLRWDMMALYGATHSQTEFETFLSETGLMAWNMEFDRGVPFVDGVAAMIEAAPQHAKALKAFDTHWEDTIPETISGSVAILEELRVASVPVYAITNFSAEKWPGATKKFPFLTTHFLDVVVSGDEKMVKPDAAIFELFCRRNDLQASDCVFIDDSEANVGGARSYGMDAIHFTTPSRLREELRQRDIL